MKMVFMADNSSETVNAPQPGSGITAQVYEWAESIVYALAAVVLIFTFIFRTVSVDGTSMQNTLQDGDRVIICNFNYTPKQGDIVALYAKNLKKPIIKRVIALGGQTVDIDYSSNKVYVDGKEFDAPIKEKMLKAGDVKLPVKVPKGCVFVLGDNRNVSLDSRYAKVGMVDAKYIVGHAVFRILPLNSIGTLK